MGDRQLLQGMIDSAVAAGQRHLFLPPGLFVVDRSPNAFWCLQVPPEAMGLRIHGAGAEVTVIRMADGSPTSTRALAVRGSHCSIDSLSMRGGQQEDRNEHRAGLFIMGPDFHVRDALFSGFTGDGIYVYTGADRTQVQRCVCSGNLRNGLTLGAAVSTVRFLDSMFVGNMAQQFDTEPGVGSVVQRVFVQDCLFDSQGASGDYVMTLGGTSPQAPGCDVLISRCVFNGPAQVVWGKRVQVSDCTGLNRSEKPSFTVYRASSEVDLSRCDFRSEESEVGLSITGTGSGSCPDRIRISDTSIAMGSGSIGITMSSMMEVELSRVRVERTGSDPRPTAMGIAIRATNPNQEARLVRIDSCSIEGFSNHGIKMAGNFWVDSSGSRTYARLDRLEVSRTRVSGARFPLQADDGAGTVRTLVLGPGNLIGSITGLTSGTRVIECD